MDHYYGNFQKNKFHYHATLLCMVAFSQGERLWKKVISNSDIILDYTDSNNKTSNWLIFSFKYRLKCTWLGTEISLKKNNKLQLIKMVVENIVKSRL